MRKRIEWTPAARADVQRIDRRLQILRVQHRRDAYR
jgi:hypothetical protein